MPGSIVQASPGGTSPRTIKYNQLLITNVFEVILQQQPELETGCQGEGAKGPQVPEGDQDQEHQQGGQGLDDLGEEKKLWVEGASRSDNDRYRSFLAYMEEKREETRLRLKEDEDRKDVAKKKEESWDLMKEAVKFLKEKRDGWRERRI
jgi:hypothetical protein